MNFLYVLPRFHTNMAELVQYLTDEGHHVDIIAFRQESNEDYSCVVPVLSKPSLLFKIKRYWFFRNNHSNIKRENYVVKYFFPSPFFLFKTILRMKPDVVIIRDKKYSTALINWICKIIGIHNVFIYSQDACLSKSEEKDNPIKAFIKRIIYPKFEYSTVEKQEVSPDMKYYPTRRLFFPRPVSFDFDAVNSRHYLADGFINLLDVGKYREYKNHFVLLKALALLPEVVRDSFRITIIGSVFSPEEKEYMTSLKRFADENNIAHLISFRNPVPHSEMKELYLKNDVLVLTSLSEQASTAVVEALRYGLVCVSTHKNGTASYIDYESGLGYIFKTDDHYHLSGILNELYDRKNEIPVIGLESFRRSSEKFSVETYLQKLMNYIRID